MDHLVVVAVTLVVEVHLIVGSCMYAKIYLNGEATEVQFKDGLYTYGRIISSEQGKIKKSGMYQNIITVEPIDFEPNPKKVTQYREVKEVVFLSDPKIFERTYNRITK